jgi:hypothetical protein
LVFFSRFPFYPTLLSLYLHPRTYLLIRESNIEHEISRPKPPGPLPLALHTKSENKCRLNKVLGS